MSSQTEVERAPVWWLLVMLLAWGYLLAAMLIGIYTISGAVTRVGSPLHWGLCVLSIGAMALVVGVCWLAWDPPEDAPHAQD